MQQNTRLGFFLAAGAYVSWGITPLFWKLIQTIPVFEITLHRIVWAFSFLFFILILKGKTRSLINLLRNPITGSLIALNALLIASNWFIYVYAINTGHVVEASLGYFINPLLSILFGVILFRERPSKNQLFAITLAIIGVAILILKSGVVPWIALILATTFATYGLIRKKMAVDTLTANTGEVIIMLPFALYFFFGPAAISQHALNYSFTSQVLLVIGGAVTAIPLLLFAESTKHLRLGTVGFLQYISPTLQFALGVFIFHEPFGVERLIAFSIIWLGLGLYTYDKLAYLPVDKKQKS